MNLEKFEMLWRKGIQKNPEYFIVELKNGAGIFVHNYKIESPIDLQFFYNGEFIAYARVNTIKSLNAFGNIYGNPREDRK